MKGEIVKRKEKDFSEKAFTIEKLKMGATIKS